MFRRDILPDFQPVCKKKRSEHAIKQFKRPSVFLLIYIHAIFRVVLTPKPIGGNPSAADVSHRSPCRAHLIADTVFLQDVADLRLLLMRIG